jgi:nitroreductase
MDVIEAMETCSAARYLKPDPVPQELIERVIYAATRASSPGNSQEWDFIVVRNHEAKRRIRDLRAAIQGDGRGSVNDRPAHKSNDRRGHPSGRNVE